MDFRPTGIDQSFSLDALFELDPIYFEQKGDDLLFYSKKMRGVFSCLKKTKILDAPLHFHPIFYHGKPYAALIDLNSHKYEDVLHIETNSDQSNIFAMSATSIFNLNEEKKQIYTTHLLLGIKLHPTKNELLVHEADPHYSPFEKSILKKLDIKTHRVEVIFDGYACVTSYEFEDDRVVFFTDVDPKLTEKGLDPFKVSPIGLKRSLIVPQGSLLVTTKDGVDVLTLVADQIEVFESELTSIQELFFYQNTIFVVGKTCSSPFGIYKVELETKSLIPMTLKNGDGNSYIVSTLEKFHQNGWMINDPMSCSQVIIRIHGGPISHVENIPTAETLFYTKQGFCLIYPNYIGSTGYGRAHRIGLIGNYGIKDVENVVSLVQNLAKEGTPLRKIIMKGKSSAGLTALLAASKVELLGLCIYCPVTTNDPNDKELAYLFPENFEPFDLITTCKTPMIVFQGDKDTLVPRKHTDCFIEEVKKKNNKVTYHVLQGEGHSIKKEAEKWCLEQEMLFFNDQLLSKN